MLTSDLLQVKVSGTDIAPSWVSTKSAGQLERAQVVLDLVHGHHHKTKGELQEAIKDIASLEVNHKFWKGLAKVLVDQCEFVSPQLRALPDMTAEELRNMVFQTSVEHGLGSLSNRFDRLKNIDIINIVSQKISADPIEIQRFLYADHKEMHILESLPELSTPLDLLHRYNLVACQSLLLHASQVRIQLHSLPAKWLRFIFRRIKFYRLMFQLWQHSETHIEIQIDGPQSVLQQSTRYGLQFAMFLPILPLLPCNWSVQAEILWGDKRKSKKNLHIDQSTGLVSHYSVSGVWKSNTEEWFTQRFLEKDRGWTLAEGEVVDIGEQQVLIPDCTFIKKDGSVKVYLEIVGFWRKNFLQSIIHKSPPNIIFAVSKRYASDTAILPKNLQERIVFFAEVLSVTEIVQLLEKF